MGEKKKAVMEGQIITDLNCENCLSYYKEKNLFVNFTFFYKKNYYFYSSAGTYSKGGIFTILNCTF